MQTWWPKPARAGVDHHDDLAGRDAEGARGPVVEHVVHHLHLDEVVAGAEAADLGPAAVERLAAHRGRVRPRHHAALLGVREVVRGRQPALGQEGDPLFGEPLELAVLEAQGAVRPRSLGHTAHQLVHQRLEPRSARRRAPSPVRTSRTPQLMSKPTPPGETTPSRLVHGRHAADGEPVSPVDVRHGDAGLQHAGQRGDVGHLLERLLVAALGEESRVRVHASRARAWRPRAGSRRRTRRSARRSRPQPGSRPGSDVQEDEGLPAVVATLAGTARGASPP